VSKSSAAKRLLVHFQPSIGYVDAFLASIFISFSFHLLCMKSTYKNVTK